MKGFLNMNKTETTDITAKKPEVKNRREWVKNIIIIFLIIMVLLTFFSNTIMNYSLPEVSVAKMSRDSVSRKYQLDVAVTSNKNYTVTSEEPRDIKRVAVKKGQEVKEGQVLFYLKEVKDSEEAKALQDQLDTESLEYEKALLKAVPDNYELSAAITQARYNLDDAIQKKNNAASTEAPEDNTYRISELTGRQTILQMDIESLVSSSFSALSSDSYSNISDQVNNYNNAKSAYDAAAAALQAASSSYTGESISKEIIEANRKIERLNTELSRLIEAGASKDDTDDKQTEIRYAQEDLALLNDTKTKIDTAQTNADNTGSDLNNAQSALNYQVQQLKSSLESELNSVTSELNSLKDSVSGGMSMPEAADMDYDSLISKARSDLSAATHALEAKIKDDNLASSQSALEIKAAKNKIEKDQKKLDEMLAKTKSTEIKSPVDGIVAEINTTAGTTVEANADLMTINLSDDGFAAKADVTDQQNKTIKKGSEAKIVSQGFEDCKAIVKNVVKSKSDSSKFTVTFDVSGDSITEGQNLKLELGESSQTYEMVIPLNALKKDESGQFVYCVKTKNTPLGNRYVVEKVNVDVVAQDDKQCAVNGEFGGLADFVITQSTKPLIPGDQVRLAEE